MRASAMSKRFSLAAFIIGGLIYVVLVAGFLLLGAFSVVGWFCHWIGVQNGYDDCLDDLNAEVARRDEMIK